MLPTGNVPPLDVDLDQHPVWWPTSLHMHVDAGLVLGFRLVCVELGTKPGNQVHLGIVPLPAALPAADVRHLAVVGTPDVAAHEKSPIRGRQPSNCGSGAT